VGSSELRPGHNRRIDPSSPVTRPARDGPHYPPDQPKQRRGCWSWCCGFLTHIRDHEGAHEAELHGRASSDPERAATSRSWLAAGDRAARPASRADEMPIGCPGGLWLLTEREVARASPVATAMRMPVR
jgi:hypothetical protein